jgi:hypothetical protein
MASPKNLLAVGILSLTLTALPACSNGAASNQSSNSNGVVTDRQPDGNVGSRKSAPNQNEKEDLISLIDTATFDVGELGRQAREKLQQHDRAQLVRALSTLRDSLPEGDARRLEIASFFCSIGHEYRANRQVIVSAFDRNSPYQNLHDDVWTMIDRLIRGGDKGLLSLGFNAVGWSDGALAEGLYDTFDDQLANDPENFLKELAKQPKKVRREVYHYIDLDADAFPRTDFEKLRRFLKSVPGNTPLSTVAKEFEAALPAKTEADRH